MNQPFGFGPE